MLFGAAQFATLNLYQSRTTVQSGGTVRLAADFSWFNQEIATDGTSCTVTLTPTTSAPGVKQIVDQPMVAKAYEWTSTAIALPPNTTKHAVMWTAVATILQNGKTAIISPAVTIFERPAGIASPQAKKTASKGP